MTARAHRTAVLAALDATPLTVYSPEEVAVVDGELPARPYAVLYFDLGTPRREKLDGVSNRQDHTFQLTYVGETAEQCMWASERARAALVDQRLTVAGRNAWRGELVTGSSQPRRDDDLPTTRPVMFAFDVFRLSSVTA